MTCTAWKVSKYGVSSGPYFLVFGQNTDVFILNTEKYGPEKTPYLDTFHAVINSRGQGSSYLDHYDATSRWSIYDSPLIWKYVCTLDVQFTNGCGKPNHFRYDMKWQTKKAMHILNQNKIWTFSDWFQNKTFWSCFENKRFSKARYSFAGKIHMSLFYLRVVLHCCMSKSVFVKTGYMSWETVGTLVVHLSKFFLL